MFKTESKAFTDQQTRMKREIKDFEQLMAEFKAATSAQIADYKKVIDIDVSTLQTNLDECQFSNQQVKTMIRNQNIHFTELSKTLGVHTNEL